MPAAPPAPALKDWFNAARYRWLADEVARLHRPFDRKRFLDLTLPGLDELSLMQRMRRTTEALHGTLPADYFKALTILKKLAPRIRHGFVSVVLPDFVSFYGLDHFDKSMEALRFFTPFGSSEFAVRAFLEHDLRRGLAIMERWTRDSNEHVRRLASEGSRPRLPWGERLAELVADPSPVVPILENLKADPSLYVRKSVATTLMTFPRIIPHGCWRGSGDGMRPIPAPHGSSNARSALSSRKEIRTRSASSARATGRGSSSPDSKSRPGASSWAEPSRSPSRSPRPPGPLSGSSSIMSCIS